MFITPPVQVEKQTKKPSVIQNLLSPVRTLGMMAEEGFRISQSIAYPIGIIFALACAALFAVKASSKKVLRTAEQK